MNLLTVVSAFVSIVCGMLLFFIEIFCLYKAVFLYSLQHITQRCFSSPYNYLAGKLYYYQVFLRAWWRHQMETFSALLAIFAGNSPGPGEFPTQRPVTRSFYVFFDLRPNKRLSKQSWGWWFETLSCSLWRHRNVEAMVDLAYSEWVSDVGNCSRLWCTPLYTSWHAL